MTKNVFKRIHIVTISRVICVDPSFHLASFSFHMKNSFHVSCDTVVFRLEHVADSPGWLVKALLPDPTSRVTGDWHIISISK